MQKATIEPLPGEVSLKAWFVSEAERTKQDVHTIEQRYYRGQYPLLKLRRVNQRVIYVTTETSE